MIINPANQALCKRGAKSDTRSDFMASFVRRVEYQRRGSYCRNRNGRTRLHLYGVSEYCIGLSAGLAVYDEFAACSLPLQYLQYALTKTFSTGGDRPTFESDQRSIVPCSARRTSEVHREEQVSLNSLDMRTSRRHYWKISSLRSSLHRER